MGPNVQAGGPPGLAGACKLLQLRAPLCVPQSPIQLPFSTGLPPSQHAAPGLGSDQWPGPSCPVDSETFHESFLVV